MLDRQRSEAELERIVVATCLVALAVSLINLAVIMFFTLSVLKGVALI